MMVVISNAWLAMPFADVPATTISVQQAGPVNAFIPPPSSQTKQDIYSLGRMT